MAALRRPLAPTPAQGQTHSAPPVHIAPEDLADFLADLDGDEGHELELGPTSRPPMSPKTPPRAKRAHVSPSKHRAHKAAKKQPARPACPLVDPKATISDPRKEPATTRREVQASARAYVRARVAQIAERGLEKALWVEVFGQTDNEAALVVLQHDWAFQTHARVGDTVHLIGPWRSDPPTLASWRTAFIPTPPGDDDADLWDQFPLDDQALVALDEACVAGPAAPLRPDAGDVLSASQLEQEMDLELEVDHTRCTHAARVAAASSSSPPRPSSRCTSPCSARPAGSAETRVLVLSARPCDQDSFLVLHPDTLLSVTRVAASSSCTRRAVLQERMRDPVPLPSKAVIMGIMLHEVLQACLVAHTPLDVREQVPSAAWPYIGDFSPDFVAARVDEQVATQREVLFALSIPTAQARKELLDAVSPFTLFGSRYLSLRADEAEEDVWGVWDQSLPPVGAPLPSDAIVQDARDGELHGRIRAITDIEEDVWSPKWGLKGKVDATILLELDHGGLFHRRTVSLAPLELKTGRATHVLEHRAQTMLYTLLMSDRYGCDIPAGLLFYSQSSQLHRVQRVPQEVKALVMARNALASFLLEEDEATKVDEMQDTPEKIDSQPAGTGSGAEAACVPESDSALKCKPEAAAMVLKSEVAPPIKLQESDAIVPSSKSVPRTKSEPAVEIQLETDVIPSADYEAFGMTVGGVSRAERLRPGMVPEPLDESFQCSKCFAFDQCALYRVAHGQPPPDASGPLAALADRYAVKTRTLTPSATAFFRKWDTILSLEHAPLAPARAALWTRSPETRERQGFAWTNLVLIPDTACTSGGKGMYRFTYAFAQAKPSSDPRGLMASMLSTGDPVLVSVPPALLSIAQGFIISLSPDRLVLGTDHSLVPALQRAKAEQLLSPASADDSGLIKFCIDKDELTGGTSRLRANLARLLLPAPGLDPVPGPMPETQNGDSAARWSQKQRASIVDLAAPAFVSADHPRVVGGLSLLPFLGLQLNPDQERAVERVLCAEDYALIQGMPGTGKTTLIAALCRVLVALGKRVLVGAYTHSALDTVMAKLVPGPEARADTQPEKTQVRLLRLGSSAKVHTALKPYTPDALVQRGGDALERRLAEANVVGTTALSAHHPMLSAGGAFDYVVLDEAAQAALPAALGPVLAGKIFVLVGDEMQLPPLVKSDYARHAGGEVSLFALLKRAHPEAATPLRLQYRMNSAINHLANVLTYRGELQCALPTVKEQRVALPWWEAVETKLHRSSSCAGGSNCWLARALDPSLQAGLLDTDALKMQSTSFSKSENGRGSNALEAHLCALLVQALVRAGGARAEDVAIVTPYRQQVGLLARAMLSLGGLAGVEVLTADRAQGKDKAVVIVSMVRTKARGVGQLLRDARRINVALTRAQKKLLVLASVATLRRDPLLARMVRALPVIPLPDDAEHSHALLSPKN